MEKLPLASVPSQSLSITLDNRLFEIAVLLGESGSTLVDVTVDGVVLRSGYRATHGAAILGETLSLKYGYLVFECDDGASYPSYTQFNLTHGLYWWKA